MPADNGATCTTLELHDYLVVIVKYMLCCVVGVKDSLARLTDTLCCHCRNILVLAARKIDSHQLAQWSLHRTVALP